MLGIEADFWCLAMVGFENCVGLTFFADPAGPMVAGS